MICLGTAALLCVLLFYQNSYVNNRYKLVRIKNVLQFYIHEAIKYKNERGIYPASVGQVLSGLSADALQAVLAYKDPWGRPYCYRLVQDQPFAYSLGRDGVQGGAREDSDIIFTAKKGEIVRVSDFRAE